LEIATRDDLIGKIKYEDLVILRDAAKQDIERRPRPFIELSARFGFPDDEADYLGLLERGIARCQAIRAKHFYFQDFAFYNARVTSRWPWRRNETLNAFMYLFLFYLFTPILFCAILDDKSVCPDVRTVTKAKRLLVARSHEPTNLFPC
jgi:hypothetical protein